MLKMECIQPECIHFAHPCAQSDSHDTAREAKDGNIHCGPPHNINAPSGWTIANVDGIVCCKLGYSEFLP